MTIERLGVSALLVPGNNRFTALRSFDAYSCTAGKPGQPDVRRLDRRGLEEDRRSRPTDAFPSVNPRPVTPDETLRYFDAKGGTAGDAREVRRRRQPVHRSAVLPGRPGPGPEQQRRLSGRGVRRSEVHATELQVFASKPKAHVDGPDVKVG